jgi:hypothetical protein
LAVLAFILACSRPPPVPDLPSGSWILEAPGVSGSLRLGAEDCRVALDGGTWGTLGEVRCRAHAEQGWMVFPVATALGEAEAVARWEERALVLPLGVREGEFEVVLERRPGEAQPRGVDPELLEAERAAWELGLFRLEGAFTGELSLARWTLELAGPQIWTDEPELVDVLEQGMDLVIDLPAEPTIDGTPTRLRVNRVLRRGVLPVGEQVGEEDLLFTLHPGPWSSRDADRLSARSASLEAERARLERLAVELRPGLGGPCPERVPPGLSQALWGYTVRFEGEACALVLEPNPVQHGRRLGVRIEASGITESIERR